MHSCGKYLLLPLVLLLFCAAPSRAQFRSEAFSQSYNDDQASPKDTSDRLFSFKEYFGALPWRGMQKHIVDRVVAVRENTSSSNFYESE